MSTINNNANNNYPKINQGLPSASTSHNQNQSPLFCAIDCLDIIGNFLSCEERVKLSQVCKNSQVIEKKANMNIKSGEKTQSIIHKIQSLIKQGFSIERLDISSGIFTNVELVEILKLCPEIKELNLDSSNITDEGLKAIATYCKNLEILNLSHCVRITGNGLKFIADLCSNLQILDLTGCMITDEGLKILAFIKNLQNLSLVGCSGLRHF